MKEERIRKTKTYEEKFPDWAEDYFKKTGETVLDLIDVGKTDSEIQTAFIDAGLRRPPRGFLDKYRDMVKNPSEMAKMLNVEWREFLRSKLGMLSVRSENILDAIILTGFQALKGEMQVKVGDLLKAIELKQRMGSAGDIDSVERQIAEFYEMEKVEIKEIDGDTKPKKKGIVPKDKL